MMRTLTYTTRCAELTTHITGLRNAEYRHTHNTEEGKWKWRPKLSDWRYHRHS